MFGYLITGVICFLLGRHIGKRKAEIKAAEKINLLEKMVEEAMFKRAPKIDNQDIYDTLIDNTYLDPKNWN